LSECLIKHVDSRGLDVGIDDTNPLPPVGQKGRNVARDIGFARTSPE
jgi:hypothetical protein